jgi:transcriptional regulator with XRE-family HTH domain
MEDINQIVAKNLADLRKNRNLTQGELAEKFNYSDKSVSKWEHGETVPDLATLQQLADFYGVTIDYLTHEPTEDNRRLYTKAPKPTLDNHQWISLAMAVLFIYFVTTVICAAVYITGTQAKISPWLPFVWATAGACMIVAVFFTHWHMKKLAVGFWIAFDWTALTSLYVNMGVYLPNGQGWNLWVLYIVGIPVMVAMLIALRYKKEGE